MGDVGKESRRTTYCTWDQLINTEQLGKKKALIFADAALTASHPLRSANQFNHSPLYFLLLNYLHQAT